MSKSCDILLDEKYPIHLSVVPRLGLVIINELEDFGETWLEIKVVENSKYKLQYDVLNLTGIHSDESVHAVGRYFVDIIHDNLHKKLNHTPEQIGPLLKFMLNINLRSEILNNRNLVMSLGTALGRLVKCL